MRSVHRQLRRLIALTFALALFGATFAPSAFAHSHPGKNGGSHDNVGSRNAHKDGSGDDQHDLSHCGAIACTAVVLTRIGYVQLRLASTTKPILRNEITAGLSWARLDPPVPR